MNSSLESVSVAGIAAFDLLDSSQRADLASSLTKRICAKGEAITRHAANEQDVYFILSGTIRVCAFSQKGKEIQFEDLESGQMFGELAAIDGNGRTSDCIALTESSLAVMSQSDFITALDTYTSFNKYVMDRLTIMLRRHIGRVFEFSAHDAKDRLRFEIYRLAIQEDQLTNNEIRLTEAPTHADIAARISSHREAVTRELKRLESEGVITWRPGEYVVHNLDALTRSQ